MSISDRLGGAMTATEACMEDRPADPNAVELATRVPAMVSALRAVLDLHQRVSSFGFMDHCGECVEFDDVDPEMGDAATRVVWPCPTYRAIAATLGEGA